MKGGLLHCMKTLLPRTFSVALGIGLLAGGVRLHAASTSVSVLPLFFESAGASNAPNRFLARGQNYQFLISPTEASIILRKVKPANAGGAADIYGARASRQLYTRVARTRFLNASSSAVISARAGFAEYTATTNNETAISR